MSLEHESQTPLARAVRKAGSQSAFGRVVGKRQSVIHGWLKRGEELPAELAEVVERELGIPRHESRPDLFAAPAPAVAATVEAAR